MRVKVRVRVGVRRRREFTLTEHLTQTCCCIRHWESYPDDLGSGPAWILTVTIAVQLPSG